ncbi:hypothetical protein AH03_12 [Erwinia phage AH03]|uniref:Uncharacterized protein n=1 Tax=Erwinia phage AH03 TaxID=2869568 RepID=A0AAE8BQ66_9CAUD|nr:hypothetical protein AH03_12 [Erwinia phage AH03]
MKKILIALALVSSFANAATDFVDVAMFDTKIHNRLGQTEINGRGCTIVQYGPEEGYVSAHTFPNRNCESLKQELLDTMSKNKVGIYSFVINGVEVMKDIKP